MRGGVLRDRRRVSLLAVAAAVLVGVFWWTGRFEGLVNGWRGGATAPPYLSVVSGGSDVVVVLHVAGMLNNPLNDRVVALDGHGEAENPASPPGVLEEPGGLGGLPDMRVRGWEALSKFLKTVDVVALAIELGRPQGIGGPGLEGVWERFGLQLHDRRGVDVRELVAVLGELRVGAFGFKVEDRELASGRLGFVGWFDPKGTMVWLLPSPDGRSVFVGNGEGVVQAGLDRYLTGQREGSGVLGSGVLRDAVLRLGLRVPVEFGLFLAGLGDLVKAGGEEELPGWMRVLRMLAGLEAASVDLRLDEAVVLGWRLKFAEQRQAWNFVVRLDELLSSEAAAAWGLSEPEVVTRRDGEVFLRARVSHDQVMSWLEE